MTGSDSGLEAVVGRAIDFVDPAAQWQRGLWNTGAVLGLRELIEASEAAHSGALSGKAVKWLAQSMRGHIASDPGVGADTERKALSSLLERDLSAYGANYHELSAWIANIEPRYLANWSRALEQENRPSREQTARALTAHLLDAGFSAQRLRSWLAGAIAQESVGNVSSLLRQAAELASAPTTSFEVMLLFEKPPRAQISRPDQWRDASQVKAWLEQHDLQRRRQHGGLLLEIEARDAHGAAASAADVVDRLLARASVGMRDSIRIARHAYIAGQDNSMDLRRTRRAEVRALEREDRLLLLERSGPVDDALELLSHLNSAPAPVAASGGWSAIESLLSGPGDEDRVITAERLAYLVACSWPRAELTTLAWAYQRQSRDDHLTAELAACASNRERAERLIAALRAGTDLDFGSVRDRLALHRVKRLVSTPREKLRAIQRRAAESFRRLYRQRNLVVHGGQVAGSGLSATLRTAAPLVGAGLDRVTHASLIQQTEPLELAARAHFEVERAGTRGAPEVTALLE